MDGGREFWDGRPSPLSGSAKGHKEEQLFDNANCKLIVKFKGNISHKTMSEI